MIIRELTGQASLDLLSGSRLGRLACAKGNQPYVVPLFFAHHDSFLYCSSTLGQKIEWMRENPLVAVEVDHIESPQQWECVVVSGHYEELADAPEMRDKRQLAWSLLQKHDDVVGARPGEDDPRRCRTADGRGLFPHSHRPDHGPSGDPEIAFDPTGRLIQISGAQTRRRCETASAASGLCRIDRK